MNLSIKVVTRPQPETWQRLVIVLVILIVVTVPLLKSGYSLPDVMTFLAAAGAARVARPRIALPAGGGRW